MNFFLLWLQWLVGKPIKLEMFEKVSKYYISNIEVRLPWDGVQTVTIELKKAKK